MGDLQKSSESKYTKLEQLESLRDQLGSSARSETKRAADAFRDNILRVLDLGKLPGQTLYRGWYACELHTKRLAEDSKIDWKNLAEDQAAAEREEYLVRIASQWLDFYDLPPDMVRTRFPIEIEKYADFQISSELTALFSAMIVGAWTAFNALVSDLWISAFDGLPFAFKGLSGCVSRIHDRRKRTQTLSPKFEPLSQSQAAWPGKKLVAEGKVSFAGLWSTRKAYSQLFSEKLLFPETEGIEVVLADDRLDAVSATGNVLIHSAGLADDKYVKQSSGCASLPTLGEGDRLTLNGQIARDMVLVVAEAGSQLIKAVETWMQTAKSK